MNEQQQWNSIVERIGSDKVKERTEAASQFRAFLSSPRLFNALVASGHHWLETLQALFHLVITERNAYKSKGATTSLKRLEDATNLVVWLVDKIHHVIPRKALKATYSHLTQMIARDGALQPYALAYLRALRSLLSHTPHLEHLDEKLWIDIVALCFAAVLGDKIRIGDELVEEAPREQRHGGRAVVEDDEEWEAPAVRVTANQEEIELVACIETAFRSTTAPFLAHGTVILRKFLRFFRRFNKETTAHLPAITALNRVFSHIELNDQQTMRELGSQLWPSLLEVWSTKNPQLKEQLVMALRFLFPFVVAEGQTDGSIETKIKPLWSKVLMEPTIRWRDTFELSLDSLRFGTDGLSGGGEESESKAFHGKTFRMGSRFDAKQAMAWSMLELGADCLERMYSLAEGAYAVEASQPEGSGRNKRRKVEDPLVVLYESLDGEGTSGEIVFKIQLILFLVERHWSTFHNDVRDKVESTIIALLVHDDLQIQSWAYVTIAALSHAQDSSAVVEFVTPKKAGKRKEVTKWDQVWTLAMRRITNPVTSRVACNTASLLLTRPDRVDPTLVVSSIESFTRDLEVQGPNFPSDAVCTFFLSIHAIAMNNVRIYRLRLPEKIFAWLTTAWTPLDGVVRTFSIGQVRPRSDPFSPLHLAVLASRICGLEQTPIPSSVYTVPDCPIASMAVDRCETAGIRNYIQGRVPAYVVEDPTVQPSSAVPTPTGQQLVPDGLALKVSAWLRKSLLALDATGTDGGDKFWATLEVSTARRYLDFASIALVFEGLVQLNNFRPSKETIKAASIVFLRLIPTLSLKKWSTVERTLLLGGLDLILVPLPDYPSISYPVLLDPGVASSLSRHLIPHRTHDTNVVNFSSLEMCLLRTIWSNEPTQNVLEELAVGLHHVLGGASAMAAAAASQATQAQATQGAQAMDVDEDDTFGAIKTSESTYASLTLRENDRSDSTCVSACVRGIVSNAMAKSRRVGSVRVPSLVDSIVEAGGTQSVAIIEHVCNAVWRGLVTLRIGEAEVMIQHIGGTLFPNYDHARSERFILAALRFLECTAPTWIRDQEDEGAAEFGEQARTLVAWYTNALFLKKLDPWRVRVRFAAFLDTYLSLDRTQTLWDGGDIATRNGEGDVLLPTGMLPSMLGDVDFRVRFHAATSAPRLFTLLYENGHDEKALFNDIRRTFINMNIDEAEIVLTQILANANMMIISHSRRRAPYLFLLDIAGVSHSFTSQIRAVLVGAAARLGLKDIASLYQIYARFYGHRNVMKRREDHSEPNPIPFIVCGYPSLRAVRKDDLRAVGAVLLTYRAEDDFQTVCDIVKRSRQACVLECLAGAIAHITVRTAFEPPEDDPSSNILVHRIEELASGAGAKDAAAITSLIASVSDEVVVAMLGFAHEDLVLVSQPHIALAADAKASKTLSDLLRHSTNLSFVELEPPYYSLQTVVDACLWFSKKFHVFNKPATVYSIVHQLLTQIHRAPFIDMKRRGLFKLAIALALSCRVVEDATILADLVQSLIVLLPDVDLAPLVASILRWCLLQWVNLAEALRGSMGELCGSLVRGVYACGALKAAALEAGGLDSVSHVADSTIGFLEALLETFAEHPTEEVDAAALLWPTPIVDPAGYATSVLVEALSTSFAPRTKYRLINELLARRRRSDNHVHQPVLWRILDAMSPSDPPEAVDCIALADLLYESSGDVERPGMDELSSSVSAVVPINVQGGQDVHKVIVVELLKSIHSSDTELASLILDTLRLVFSVTSAEDLLSMGELSPHSLGVATFLASPTLLRPERARAREQRSLAELSSSLWKSKARVHDDWIRRFAQLLADYRAEGDAFFAQLVPILDKSVALASSLVPILLHSILIQGSSADDDDEECILSEYLEALLSSRSTSNECISCIVDIIVYLRRNSKPHDTALTSCDKWLRVPWILAAEGAVRVGRYLTALLFLELSHEYDSTSSPDITADDLLARGQDLLYEIYANIDEPDGFYGRESPDVRKALVKRYEHEGRWSEAFSIYGADYESQSRQDNAIDTSMTPGVVQSLASSGFNRLAMSILQPARAQGDIKDDCIATGLPYELGWRTESWDLPVEQSSATDSSVALYRALRSLHVAREPSGLQASVAVSIVAEVKKLASVSINLPTPNGDALSTILALREVHQWSMLKIGDDDSLLSRFSIVPPSFKFSHAERILSTRISLLRALRLQEQSEQIGNLGTELSLELAKVEKQCHLQLSAVARLGGHLQVSMNAVTLAHKLLEPGTDSSEVEEEFANVVWAQEEHGTAISLLKTVQYPVGGQRALVLARLGEWTAQARLKNSRQIHELYFEPAIEALKTGDTNAIQSGQVYGAYARFADSQYQEAANVANVKRSRYELYSQRKEAEFIEIDRQLKAGDATASMISQLEKGKTDGISHLKTDLQQVEEAEELTNLMLRQALENYAKALTSSEEHNDYIFRFCALWLAHADDDDLHANLSPLLKEIPSHKFVFLSYQLSARLAKQASPTPFSKNVSKIVLRLCSDHPFHSLFAVHALRLVRPGTASAPSARSKPRRSSETSFATLGGVQTARSKAAEEIFARVKQIGELTTKVMALERSCDAYVEWAALRVQDMPIYLQPGTKSVKKSALKIQKSIKLLSDLRDLPIPVATYTIPVDLTLQYKNLPCISHYGETFRSPGGVHVPKLVTCFGNDGKEYKQLFKGEDDIRQDAVMEQTFDLINTLLNRDDRTRRRNLRLRTYKVIPLPGFTGVIEFVDNTQSLADTLLPLYAKFVPKAGFGPKDARAAAIAIEAAKRRAPTGNTTNWNVAKDENFLNTLHQLPPVMRHLFFQKHKLPSLWFDIRTNYSRSVATTAIVGHIVGLGDRHASNILMDEVKGELVQIDLGIAFDQGTRLPIPELVPFRLTQNIIDGFGMTGVEGVFRRCAEETLRVLRERASLVATVLEVFKHDPLQSWAISADVAKRVQGSEDVDDGTALEALPDDADRALSIVAAKLDKKLSVEYTVNQLIQQATDPQNLARIFSGWQPYL